MNYCIAVFYLFFAVSIPTLVTQAQETQKYERFFKGEGTKSALGGFQLEFTPRGNDENLLLAPTEDVLRLREKQTWFEASFLRVKYVPLKKSRWKLSTSYALRDDDIQNHTLSMEGLWKGRLGLLDHQLQPGYSFEYSSDYSPYPSRQSFNIPYRLNVSPRNQTVLRQDFHFKAKQPAGLSAEEEASNRELGITHFFHTRDWRHFVKVGFTKKRELPMGNNRTNSFLTGFQFTAPLNVKLYSDISLQKDHYFYKDDSFNKKGEKVDYKFSNTLSRHVTENLSFFANYTTKRSDETNIRLKDFEKDTFSFGITFRH